MAGPANIRRLAAAAFVLAAAVLLPPAASAAAARDAKPNKAKVEATRKRAAELLKARRYADAAAEYEKALALAEARLGRDNPDHLARARFGLGDAYYQTGRYSEAEELYTHALRTRQAKLPADHRGLAPGFFHLARLYATLGKWDKALAEAGAARRLRRRHVARILPGLSAVEQATFLGREDGWQRSMALSLGLLGSGRLQVRSASAEWVLNGKAVALESLAARARLALEARKPRIEAVARKLSSARGRLATLTMGLPSGGDYGRYRERIAALARQEEQLAKELGRLTGRVGREDPWVTLAEVRRVLPREAALVELARFHFRDVTGRDEGRRTPGDRYVAWVIPPEGAAEVAVLDLGPAGAIDPAAAAFLRSVSRRRGRTSRAPAGNAAPQLRRAGARLASLIWQPLARAVGDAEHVILSPDAALWLVPWEALPTSGGKYLIERKRISYVVTGRDLGPGNDQTGPAGGVVFADPDYDLGASEMAAETRRLLAGVQLAMASERSGELSRVRWRRLAGSAAEAEAVAPRLRRYVRAEPAVYTGRRALEGVFKALRSPRVLLMSTHGFFLADQDYDQMPAAPGARDRGTFLAPRRPTTRPAEAPRIEDPLLRCGLVLAGANRRGEAAGGDDGILTALEVVGTDLRGTELVVLSACETGLGRVQCGEGVAGLRQAFQLAGAKTVVSTLWKIPDKQTAELVARFFENLAAGQGKAEALRGAQLRMIAGLRRSQGAAHPYYWAAFTLTGAWR